jgi:formamidopyrimidine-DNA glycosylase
MAEVIPRLLMPELPELEVVKDVLLRRIAGRPITSVELSPKGGPIIVRDFTGQGLAQHTAGRAFEQIDRRGKFLLFRLSRIAETEARLTLAINPKLTGRLQLTPPNTARAGPVQVTFRFENPAEELRYIDSNRMGQIYLTAHLNQIPTFAEMGPEPLEISLEAFAERLRLFRGEIKGILIRAAFIAGIGNAYADEILWQARLHPYRKRPSLSRAETEALYLAMQQVLRDAIGQVRQEMGDEIHLKPRDFFAVHLREGEPCPRCGSAISAITANQRITNFCRTCQPGGLIRGL